MLRTIATRIAPTAPALCAVHCALSPLLALAVPAVTGPGAERFAFVLTTVLAAVSLVVGFRAHGRRSPVLLALAGLVVWGASVGGTFLPLPEVLTTACGSLATAAAMLWSARLSHGARCHVCASAEPSRVR